MQYPDNIYLSGVPMNWIVVRLKSLFVIAAIGGPLLAGYMWWDGQRIKDVETRGIETTAGITGATRTRRRRGGTSYSLALAWKDAAGNTRTADDVSVSRAFADQIIQDDKIVGGEVHIKYLEDDMTASPILLEDSARLAETDQNLMYVGGAAGVIGIVGLLLLRLGGRRRSKQA